MVPAMFPIIGRWANYSLPMARWIVSLANQSIAVRTTADYLDIAEGIVSRIEVFVFYFAQQGAETSDLERGVEQLSVRLSDQAVNADSHAGVAGQRVEPGLYVSFRHHTVASA